MTTKKNRTQKNNREPRMCILQNLVVFNLRAKGHRIIYDGGEQVCIFANPATPNEVVEVRPLDAASAAWEEICRQHAANPYFPHIIAAETVNTDPPLFVVTRENLMVPAMLTGTKYKPAIGPAQPVIGLGRAVALLLCGDKDHETAHNQMLRRKPELRTALRTIGEVLARHADDRDAVICDPGMDIDGTSHAVLFRPCADNNTVHPVFINPFRTITDTTDEQRAEIRAQAARLLAISRDPEPAPAPAP